MTDEEIDEMIETGDTKIFINGVFVWIELFLQV